MRKTIFAAMLMITGCAGAQTEQAKHAIDQYDKAVLTVTFGDEVSQNQIRLSERGIYFNYNKDSITDLRKRVDSNKDFVGYLAIDGFKSNASNSHYEVIVKHGHKLDFEKVVLGDSELEIPRISSMGIPAARLSVVLPLKTPVCKDTYREINSKREMGTVCISQ